MCKQEDYFKNWSTCTTKNIFPCHASTWRPKPCRALGWGTTERSRFTSLTENSGSNQQSASEAKRKSYPDAVLRWEAFFPQKVKFGWSFLNFFSLFVLVGGRGRKRGVSDRRKKNKWEKKPTSEMYTFQTPPKLQYTVCPQCTLIMPTTC